MEVISRIYKRVKSDSGDAVIVLGIMLMIVTIVIGGMLLDISKAFQLKSSYIEAAQKAAQAAIRYQNSEGFLEAEAAAEALRVYETVSKPSVIKEGYMSACKSASNSGEQIVPKINITFTEGSSSDYSIVSIDSSLVNDGDEVDDILSKINYDSSKIKNGEFKGIKMEFYESTPNIILPKSSIILTGRDDGAESVNCQQLGIRVKATVFSGQEGKFN